jgi:hypothetical protein
MLSREEYLRAIARVVEFLRAGGVRQLLVAYGFGCDCPDDQLYQDVPVPLDHLHPFIAEAEAADYYRVGKDNLHVKDPDGRAEFLFCHESDIHFISEDAELVERLKAAWLAEGFCTMFVRLGTEWQAVDGQPGPA